MNFTVIRIFFAFISAIVGFQLGSLTTIGGAYAGWWGCVAGLIVAGLLIAAEMAVHRVSVRGLSTAVFGLLIGLLLSWLVSGVLNLIPMDESLRATMRLVFTLVFCYLGMIMALRGRDEFNVVIPYVRLTRQDQGEGIVLLDTSVIIDGRIADVCQTKFIEGRLVIPRFILRELQHIADSSDAMRRNRGRRGLEVLNRIRKTQHLDVRVHEDDVPDVAEVDGKLIKLGKVLGAKILTTDYNLNRVAELQGITVLNINELANALRPVVLPGESLEVKVVKEGKEYNQGVAYLDDGTMVVIENGRFLIGQTVRAVVTSVLQTSAGRMVFAKPESDAAIKK